MKIRIDRTRMACGPGSRDYSYDGAVALKDLGIDHKPGCTTICRGDGRYISFEDATRPPEIDAMEQGWDRYQAALAHEAAAKVRLLEIARTVYPELAGVSKWPELWISVPELEAKHAVEYVEVNL